MNNYRITYELEDKSLQTQIVERSEAAARKEFKARVKGSTITDVELVAENVPATKDQERDALATIKKLVEDLGPQSYLKTAFDGVFEVAEMNIEEDAAYSFPGRVNILEDQLREMGSKYNAARSDAEVLRSQLEYAQEQVDALKRQQLPEELRRDLWVMVTTEAEVSRARMAEAADKMAAGAENPGCVLFKDSVARYRAEKTRAEAMEQRAAELDAMEPKSEKGGAA
ncbi:Uncharacterised protein [Flavonifractor plautii]|nr:Uncharacterised protein [Flavonifractor plautii]